MHTKTLKIIACHCAFIIMLVYSALSGADLKNLNSPKEILHSIFSEETINDSIVFKDSGDRQYIAWQLDSSKAEMLDEYCMGEYFNHENPNPGYAYSTILGINKIKTGQDSVAVVFMTTTMGSHCHAFSQTFGYALYRKTGAVWIMSAKNYNLGHIGMYGEIPGVPRTISLAKNQYGFIVQQRDMEQGSTTERTYIFAMIKDSLYTSLSINTYSDDSGAYTDSVKWSYKSTLKFRKHPHSSYDDLIVETKGTRPYDDHTIGHFKETHQYVFTHNEYVDVEELHCDSDNH
jgi:hypothetical protein